MSGALYAENRCAVTWMIMVVGLYAPAVAISLVVAALIAGNQAFFWIALAILMIAVAAWVAGSGDWVRYAWPTGIRMDAAGVRIGGVRWAEKHPGRVRTRKAIVPRQYSQVFSCPWGSVLGIGVTTDRDLLRKLNRQAYRGRKLTPLGNLAVPFMRAALVIWVDEARAQVPEIRPATGLLWFNYAEGGYHQPVWVVPTRRPAEVARALPALPVPAAAIRDPRELVTAGAGLADWSLKLP
jgi:hypothetical protein